MKAKTLLLATLLCLVPISMGAMALAQDSGTEETPKVEPKKEDLSTPEQRWNSKTDEERQVLLERFEQLRKLSPEDREALKRDAHELAVQRRTLEESLAPERRRDLEKLPPHERQRILREHQIAEHRRVGEELRAELGERPRELVEEMVRRHQGPPRPFHEMRDEMRIEFGDKVVKRFGELGTLTPEEEQRMLALEGPERLEEALRIKRKRIEEAVLVEGLPEGVTQQQWDKMLTTDSVEKFLKKSRKRGFDEHLGLGRFGEPGPVGPGRPKGHGEPGGDRSGGPPDRNGDSPGRSPMDPPREPRPDDQVPGPKDPKLKELSNVLRPTLEDRLAINELPKEERHEQMSKRLKKRAASFLAENATLAETVFTEEERMLLQELDPMDYVDFLVSLVHEQRGLGPRESKERKGGKGFGGQPGHTPRDRGPRR